MSTYFESVYDQLSQINEDSTDHTKPSMQTIDKTVFEVLDSEEFKKHMDTVCKYSDNTDEIKYAAKCNDGYIIEAHVKYWPAHEADRYMDACGAHRSGQINISDYKHPYTGSRPSYVTCCGIDGRGEAEGTIHKDNYIWNYTWEEQIAYVKKAIKRHEEERKLGEKRRAEYEEKQAQIRREASQKRVAKLSAAGLKLKELPEFKEGDADSNDIYKRMCNQPCSIYYNDLEVSYAYGSQSWEDGSYEHEGEEEIEWEYEGASKGEICEMVIQDCWDEFMPDSATGEEEHFEDILWAYMEEKFDGLYDIYEEEIKDHYRSYAEEDAEENWEHPDSYDW